MPINVIQLAVLTSSRYNILPLTSRCNLRCLFCSHRQNPPGVETWFLPPLKLDEVDTLLDFLDGERKIVIGESATRLIEGEPMTHPEFLEILTRVRRRFPSTPMEITTNGTFLTAKVAGVMAQLGPLEINLSLNSASPIGRRKLMGDKEAITAIAAPLVLREAGIPYHGSLVAMPWITGWQDFRKTILYLARSGARTIRIFLPGYTRLNQPEMQVPPYFREQMERELEYLRGQTEVPLLLEPPEPKDLSPVVEGVIPASPAHRAGLKRGDVILEVDGRQPRSRVEAHRMVSREGNRRIVVFKKQGQMAIALNLKVPKDGSGLTFTWDLDPDVLDILNEKQRRHRAGHILVMTSELAYEAVKGGISLLPGEWEIVKVKNIFFGGNIACAGLLTTEDYIAAWLQWSAVNFRPLDLIILPGISFDFFGNDLTGRHYSVLETVAGVPVETLDPNI